MKAWTSWEVIRHQVAIGGWVTDESGNRLEGLSVSLSSMPDVFSRGVSTLSEAQENIWEDLAERPDRTMTRPHGIFYFLDLPAGQYTINVVNPATGSQDEKKVDVVWDKTGNINKVIVNMRVLRR